MTAVEGTAYGRGHSMQLTRAALQDWNRRPWPVLRRWLLGAVVAAVFLLGAVLAVALLFPGRGRPLLDQPPLRVGTLGDVRQILSRNVLVLALHALSCVAGFIAGSELGVPAGARTGLGRALHRHGAGAAIGFVVVATLASIAVQAVTIGTEAGQVARALHVSPARLLVALLPHALPELTALFLPLAAWVTASRRGAWDQLLAAAMITVAFALPVLVACAGWEVFVAPHLVTALV